ncbi:hypothetical protein FKP32DRAFT_1007753 [Trametes sanguinea]|nr:hypothetical protein FKP32DRAFT_1007753 [Trametes sanguinea]
MYGPRSQALVIPGNLIYAAVTIVGAKLYANSVLALLNSRCSIDNRYIDDFMTFNTSALNQPESSQARRGQTDTMTWHVREVRSRSALFARLVLLAMLCCSRARRAPHTRVMEQSASKRVHSRRDESMTARSRTRPVCNMLFCGSVRPKLHQSQEKLRQRS